MKSSYLKFDIISVNPFDGKVTTFFLQNKDVVIQYHKATILKLMLKNNISIKVSLSDQEWNKRLFIMKPLLSFQQLLFGLLLFKTKGKLPLLWNVTTKIYFTLSNIPIDIIYNDFTI